MKKIKHFLSLNSPIEQNHHKECKNRQYDFVWPKTKVYKRRKPQRPNDNDKGLKVYERKK